MGSTDFSDQFRKVIIRHKRIGYNLNFMQQSACLVFNPITVDKLCWTLKLHAFGSGVRLFDGPDLKLFILVGWDRSSLFLLNDILLQTFNGVICPPVTKHVVSV